MTLSKRIILLFFISLPLLASCDQQGRKTEVVQALTDEDVRRWVERSRASLDDELQDVAQSVATSSEVANYLNKEAERNFRARVKDGIKYADLFQRYYRDNNFKLLFAGPSGPKPRSIAIIDVVKKAPEHSLSTSFYSLNKIDSLSKKLSKQNSKLLQWQTIALAPQQVERLIAWILKHEANPETPKGRAQILAAIIGYDVPDLTGRFRKLGDPPLPEVASQVDTYLEQVQKAATTLAHLELRIADAALRYARDMKHFNLRNYTWKEKQEAGGAVTIIYKRLEGTLNDLVKTKTPEEAAAVMHDLEPKFEQYAKLKTALARYLQIKKDGGWPRVTRFPVSLYARGPEVEKLRKRLEIEGFVGPSPAQIDAVANSDHADSDVSNATAASSYKTRYRDVMDKDLIAAFRSYQRTHQFKPQGYGSQVLWNSLNVPVERRIKQIRLGLDRIRDFAYQNEPDYIYVNIPDFYGEAWFDHTKVARFEVVVGNARLKCNEKKEVWEMPNATPIQAAKMKYVILNPYWNVPRRIIDEELLPMNEDDEEYEARKTYLETRGYEFLKSTPGKEQIRQKPGPKNALGKVKFIFPNRFNTYMHDTPKKEFFNFPLRAFSHGCVRVQEPIKFAELLLERYAGKNKKWIEDTLESDRTIAVQLDTEIPVFFEYVTVRVDDDGYVNFLADIYKYDQDEFDPRSAGPKKCFIPKEDTKKKGEKPPATDGQGGDTDSETTDASGEENVDSATQPSEKKTAKEKTAPPPLGDDGEDVGP